MASTSTRFGTGRLFLSDTRMALLLLNEARHRCLHSVFGVSREQENLLTAVIAVGAASATFGGAQRVLHAPVRIRVRESATAVVLLREAAFGIGGPDSRVTPMFGALTAAALAGRVALPAVRRAAHSARLAEHRAREHRLTRYLAAVGREPTPSGGDDPPRFPRSNRFARSAGRGARTSGTARR